MAIRRCPYCKAIIDEGSEYCSNCGTQLIFPEDEFVDEEIPGEKIIDVNEEVSESEEKQNPVEGKGPSTKGKGGRKKAAVVSKKEEEKITEPEAETESEADIEAKPDEEEIAEEEKEELPVYMQEDISEEPPSEELVEQKEDLSQKVKEEAEEEAEEVATQDESADFRTEDLEGMVDPAEKEKEEIEKFLNSLKEERERTKKYYEETGELPPWAQSMREGKATEAHFEEEEEYGDEPIEPEKESKLEDREEAAAFEESFEEERVEEPAESQESEEPEKGIPFEEEVTEEEEAVRAADTGMGLPEGVDQQNLPFSKGMFGSTSAREKKRRLKKPDVSFSPWIKSRIFDVLIIAGIWLVGLWLASRVIGVGFFQLLTSSAVQALLFFVVLLVIYFFLFLFFLGETLGDHLFSEES
jgi:hypothetical protein